MKREHTLQETGKESAQDSAILLLVAYLQQSGVITSQAKNNCVMRVIEAA